MNARLEVAPLDSQRVAGLLAKMVTRKRQQVLMTVKQKTAFATHLSRAEDILREVSPEGADTTLDATIELLDLLMFALTASVRPDLASTLKTASNTVAAAIDYRGPRKSNDTRRAIVAEAMVDNLVAEFIDHREFPERANHKCELDECCAATVAQSLAVYHGERVLWNKSNSPLDIRIARWREACGKVLFQADLTSDRGRRAAAVRIVKQCVVADGMNGKQADNLFTRGMPLESKGRVRS